MTSSINSSPLNAIADQALGLDDAAAPAAVEPASDEPSFASLGLSPEIVSALQAAGYVKPTPVQQRAIPAGIAGRDLLVSSPTGSGKTAAFMLPAIERFAQLQKTQAQQPRAPREPNQGDRRARRPQPVARPGLLVLTPTRELAMLVVMFAGPFILIGTLLPRPQFNMVTMLVAVNTATFISIQGAYDADFFVFLNSNLAGVAGLLFAYVWTRATRPFGAELAVRRLLRSGWEDVARSASTQPLDDQRNHASRMLDRVTHLLPRLGASDDHRHPSIESFRDLRIALNALDLRRSRRRLSGDVPDAIDRVLAGVTDHYERCVAANARQPAPPALLATIDDALRRVAGRNLPGAAPAENGGEPAAPATPATHRRLRDTLHALVGLRLSLYPAAAGQPPRAPDGARA